MQKKCPGWSTMSTTLTGKGVGDECCILEVAQPRTYHVSCTLGMSRDVRKILHVSIEVTSQ
jgi:hypothetical protein